MPIPHVIHDGRQEANPGEDVNDHTSLVAEQCLLDLYLTDPRDDKIRIEQTRGDLMEDTPQLLVKHPHFQEWFKNEKPKLLWIHGGPGLGKTMSSCGIINYLESTSEANHLSFFFCQANDLKHRSAASVLRGLIYLLLIKQKFLIKHLQERYDRIGRKLFSDDYVLDTMSELFEAMTRDSRLARVYLLIDALDECGTELKRLLGIIDHSVSATNNVKWIISSRNIPDIEKYLGPDDSGTKLSLELNVANISDKLDAYVNHKVSQLTSIEDDEVLQEKVLNLIRNKANESFLWVALTCQELEQVDTWDVLNMLDSLPTDLSSLYRRNWELIQQMSPKTTELCRLVLATVTLAYRPLHILEIGVLSDLPEQVSRSPRLIKTVLKRCSSFLIVRKDHVYFIHQSAREYLTRNATETITPAGFAKSHHSIVLLSLQAMSKMLRRDIYNLQSPGFPVDKIILPDPDPLVMVHYSCIYWIDHLFESCPDFINEISYDGLIFNFLKTHFLHWLESLSLSGNLSNGETSINKLLRAVQVFYTITNIVYYRC
jgi:NACHT domain